MGRHAAPRWRAWFGRGRTRAVLSLGVVLSLGAVGTTAYWTDTAAVSTGPVTSGSMDLQVAQTTAGPWGAVGTGTAYAASHITVANIAPAESYAFTLAVRNVGHADFTYTAAVTQGALPAWTFVGTPITVQLYTGSPVDSATIFPVQDTCSGTALAPAATVTTGSATVIPATRRLNAGATDAQLCVLVTMVAGAANDNQGKQGQLRLDFTATQVTS